MDEINLSIDYIKHQQNNKQYWQVNDNCILALKKTKTLQHYSTLNLLKTLIYQIAISSNLIWPFND